MSRIGKQSITIPAGVTVEITDTQVTATGNGNTLKFPLQPTVKVKQEDGQITVSVVDPSIKEQRAFWGLSRSMIQNMVIGVSEGYTKSLEIVGVGYKFDLK